MNRTHFVYWMFDKRGRCLYVGCTMFPRQRWYEHRCRRPEMVAQVASKRMAGPYERATAYRIEREQQRELSPVYDGHRIRRQAQLAPLLRSMAADRQRKAAS